MLLEGGGERRQPVGGGGAHAGRLQLVGVDRHGQVFAALAEVVGQHPGVVHALEQREEEVVDVRHVVPVELGRHLVRAVVHEVVVAAAGAHLKLGTPIPWKLQPFCQVLWRGLDVVVGSSPVALAASALVLSQE